MEVFVPLVVVVLTALAWFASSKGYLAHFTRNFYFWKQFGVWPSEDSAKMTEIYRKIVEPELAVLATVIFATSKFRQSVIEGKKSKLSIADIDYLIDSAVAVFIETRETAVAVGYDVPALYTDFL